MIGTLTTKDFNEAIKGDAVIVKFYTKNCTPCKITAPKYMEIAENNPQYSFFQVNAEEEYELTENYSVLSVPTFILFKKGEEIMRMNHMKLSEENIKGAYNE